MPKNKIPSYRGSLRRSGYNVLKLLSGKIINVPLGLAQIYLTTRLIGDKGYGFLVLIYAFGQLVGDVAEFQSWQTVLHYGLKPYQNKDLPLFQRVLRFSFLLDACSATFALVVSVLIAINFSNILGWPPEWHYLGIIFSFSVLFTTSATANGVLLLLNRYDLLAIQGTTTTTVRFLGIAFLTLIHGGMLGAVIVWTFATFMNFITIFVTALYQLYKQGFLKGFFNRINDGLTKDLPGIWKFAWNTNINMTFSLVSAHITAQIIGSMLGTVQNARYSIANKISEAIAKPVIMLQSTLYPEMTRSWQGSKPSHLYKMALQITLLTGGIISVIFLILPYIAPYIISLLLHKSTTPETLHLLYWLAGAKAVILWGISLEPILITTGNTKGASISRGINSFIYIPMLIIFIQKWGIQGIGPATLISSVLLVISQILFVIKYKKKTITQ